MQGTACFIQMLNAGDAQRYRTGRKGKGKNMNQMNMEKQTDLAMVNKYLKNAIRLFPAAAPGSEHVQLEETVFEEDWENGLKKVVVKDTLVPGLIPFIPEHPDENRTAIIVIPGGAYRRQVLSAEGVNVAKWLNSLGITAFVLKHRLPVNLHKNPTEVPLIDVQRAVRLVRSRASEFGIHREHIGVMGFSAGGHVASMAATCFSRSVYEPVDAADAESARPDFCVLGYPAISYEVFLKSPESRQETAKHLVDTFLRYSTEKLVSKDSSPVFIFETDDDKTTWSEHSVAFYLAARNAGVPAELHIFKQGGHGFGLGNIKPQVSLWQQLFVEWLHTLPAAKED